MKLLDQLLSRQDTPFLDKFREATRLATLATTRLATDLKFHREAARLATGLFGAHDVGAAGQNVSYDQEMHPDTPKFIPGKPWRVLDFRTVNDSLDVDIRDSRDVRGILKLPFGQVQTIEHVDQTDDSSQKRLYAYIQPTPSNWRFQAVPTKIYLGDVSISEWKRLRERLKQSGIGFIWDQAPDRENIQRYIPSSWEPHISY